MSDILYWTLVWLLIIAVGVLYFVYIFPFLVIIGLWIGITS